MLNSTIVKSIAVIGIVEMNMTSNQDWGEYERNGKNQQPSTYPVWSRYCSRHQLICKLFGVKPKKWVTINPNEKK